MCLLTVVPDSLASRSKPKADIEESFLVVVSVLIVVVVIVIVDIVAVIVSVVVTVDVIVRWILLHTTLLLNFERRSHLAETLLVNLRHDLAEVGGRRGAIRVRHLFEGR